MADLSDCTADDVGTTCSPTAVLSTLSDRQLVDACRHLPWERRLCEITFSGWGCGASLLLASAVVFGCHLAARHIFDDYAYWIFLIPLGFVVAMTFFVWLTELAERRGTIYLQELRRRYAGAKLDEYIRQAEVEPASNPEADVDTIVIVSGASLPHGGSWLIRIRLSAGKTGSVEVRRLRRAPENSPDGYRIELAAGQVPLSREEGERMLGMIRELAAGPTKMVFTSYVRDGSPAALAVWVRGRGVVLTGRCNLSGVSPDSEAHPVMRLFRAASELGERHWSQASSPI